MSDVTQRRSTVAVFGEMLVDAFPDRSVLGGAPLNVAFHLKRFGLDPVLVTRVGTDEDGDRLVAQIASAGLDTSGVQRDPDHPTGRVRITLDDGGHRFEILENQAYDFVDPVRVAELAATIAPGLFYFGTLAQRADVSRRALDTLLDVWDCPRWLDINLRSPFDDPEVIRCSLEAADHVKLNDGELETVAALYGFGGRDAVAWAGALIGACRLASVVVTCGADGAWSLDAGGTYVRVEGKPLATPLADTVGAGDGFAAVSIVGLVRGWPARETLERADAFARAICGIHGAIPQDPAFYTPFLVQ